LDPRLDPNDVGGSRERVRRAGDVACVGVDAQVGEIVVERRRVDIDRRPRAGDAPQRLSLLHITEPTRPEPIAYAL
jgi:hypothetical protein